MYALGGSYFQHRTVLGKQRDGRRRLALEHPFEVLCQGQPGAIERHCSGFAAQVRSLDELLHHGFHATQNAGLHRQSDHFECTNCLVQMLACRTQRPVVELRQFGAAGLLYIAGETPQRLVGEIK